MASTTAPTAAAAQPIVKLYWLEKSRSQRILWLLEELSVSYELITFHRDPKTHMAPPELKKIHSLGKSPIISVSSSPTAEPVVIAESAVIIEYLLDHFGGEEKGLLPKRWKEGQQGQVGGENEEWLRFRFLMHYAEGSLMPYMLLKMVVNNIRTSPVPFFIKPITAMISSKIDSGFLTPTFVTHFTFLESQISSSPGAYLCGSKLTGADIMMSFPLIAGRGRTGLEKESYPKLWEYIERLEKEKGYLKAVDKIVEIEGKYVASL